MRHTKHLVGGLLVAASTISSVVIVDAGIVDRAATVDTPARRLDPEPAAPIAPIAPEQQAGMAMVESINVERARRGLAPLTWHPQVAAAAQAHSGDMAARGAMGHTGSDGSDAGVRLRRAGFDWTAWGENVAAGFTTGPAVFEAWMDSQGHRSQILGDFAVVGIAAVAAPDGTPYWTLVAARG